MKRNTFATMLLIGLAIVNSFADGAIVEANGVPATTDCGGGLQVVEGSHTGVLNLLGPEDINKSWHLTGQLWQCGDFSNLKQVAAPCTLTTSTNLDRTLYCFQENAIGCFQIVEGLHTRTTAGGDELRVSADFTGTCAMPTCDEDPPAATEPNPSPDAINLEPSWQDPDTAYTPGIAEELDSSRLRGGAKITSRLGSLSSMRVIYDAWL